MAGTEPTPRWIMVAVASRSQALFENGLGAGEPATSPPMAGGSSAEVVRVSIVRSSMEDGKRRGKSERTCAECLSFVTGIAIEPSWLETLTGIGRNGP
jgi:hypothetical protein